MIRSMRSKFLALGLVFAWLLLSGLDLLEDLDKVPSDGAISSAASTDGPKWKRNGWGALANNIVESATRLPHAAFESASRAAAILDLDAGFDFRRCFRLHKLYRVFQI
jgi:hypothetical protein